MADESYFKVLLPDGRNVNILTTQGADAFVRAVGQFISINMKQVRQARKSLGNSPQQRQMLKQTYTLFGCVAEHASPEAFSSLSHKELDSIIQHANDVFSKLAENSRWTKTGVLEDYNQELLDALIPNHKHIKFVKKSLDMGLMRVLARFCSVRDMPCADVTESILCLVNNCRITLSIDEWENEKIMKRLEATGILAQYIRCITQPSPGGGLELHLGTLDALMSCSSLVKKKYKAGEPSGEILQQVIACKDGHRGERDETVMVRLQNLEKIAGLFSSSRYAPDGTRLVGNSCRKCNKSHITDEFQKKLLVCSRCKDVYYCSKECQRADWKEHKKICEPPVEKKKSQSSVQSTIISFVRDNYYVVMKEIVKVTQEQNVDKQELILELDYYAREGSAPALRDPPEFTVGITRHYIEGSRPAEPDWFWKGTDVYDKNIENFLAATRDQYQRMTGDHLLCMGRAPNGGSGVYRIQLKSPSNRSLYSDGALDAFSRAMNGDYSRLGQVYDENLASYIRSRRTNEARASLFQNPDMQSLMARINDFTSSDRYRQLMEEFGSDSDEEEEDEH